MTTAPPLRFGIVGCGGAATAIAGAIDASDRAEVHAVHDRDPGHAAALAGPRGALVHGSLRRLLADDAIDVVYVALPHDRLASTAIAALRAGRHVLVEKPAAIRAADLDRVRGAALAAGRSVGVVLELRFVPTVLEARRLVAAGAIGSLRMVRVRTLIDKPARYWASGPTGLVADTWRASRRRAGGGVVLMNTIHQLDLVRAITGRQVTRAAAVVVAGAPGVEVEDVAVAALELEGGLPASLAAAAHAPGAVAAETIELDGTDGALRLGDPYAPRPRLDVFLRRPQNGVPAGRWTEVATPPADPWRVTIEAFVDAILGGRDPVPGLDDAATALEAVLAVYRSARTGRFERTRSTLPRAAAGSLRPPELVDPRGDRR
jgi:UDP-N-acetyl-2-amino-2-deoxyglucuronate dehydrogenase